jgi:hypothetical protein
MQIQNIPSDYSANWSKTVAYSKPNFRSKTAAAGFASRCRHGTNPIPQLCQHYHTIPATGAKPSSPEW